MSDEITVEDIRRAVEILNYNAVPKILGFICPYCCGHIKDAALLNPKYHEPDCPVVTDLGEKK